MCEVESFKWPGTDMLLFRASLSLEDTEQSTPQQLSEADIKRLREASNIFYGAVAWRRFCAQALPARDLPDRATESHELLSMVGETFLQPAQQEFWDGVSTAVGTLNAVIVGQHPGPEAVAAAANLCKSTGECVLQLHRQYQRMDDDD